MQANALTAIALPAALAVIMLGLGLSLPLIVNLSLVAFVGQGKVIPLQFAKIVQIFAVVLVPVAIGMLIKSRRPALAARLEKPVRLLSAAVLLGVVAAAVAKERAHILE